MAVLYAFKAPPPVPSEVNVTIPSHVDKEMFEKGFRQGMSSNVLCDFRASFRAGFREAKLYLARLQRERGIIRLPLRQKLIITDRRG